MSTTTTRPTTDQTLYPDDDGNPMAANTLQFKWIVLVKENLESIFRDDPNVFVAGDLLWYAREGDPRVRTAPDVLVVFGRPKGRRGSYMQWEEEGIPPQVVFEILSPGNRGGEMARKFRFYDDRGVEEYYIYDPDDGALSGWRREGGGKLEEIPDMKGHVSPRLGIRFEPGEGPDNLKIYTADGSRFKTYQEIQGQADAEKRRADAERQRAEAARRAVDEADQRAEAERQRAEAADQRAEEADQRAEAERQRAERLAARLRALGESID